MNRDPVARLNAGEVLQQGRKFIDPDEELLVGNDLVRFVFGFGLVMPASTARALHPFPRIAGSASAMMGFLQISVGAAGSLVLSVVYDGSAFSLGLAMTALAALGAAGYLLLAGGGAPEPEEA